MARKPQDFPDPGELVVGTITNVNPYSASVSLDEYKGKEAMLHISEVARKWVGDIREFAKVGKKIVGMTLKVDPQKNFISISVKRVNKKSAEEKIKEFKREQKAERLLDLVAKENSITLDQAYEKIGFKLQESFGEMFKAFQTSVKNEDLLRKKGIEDKWIKAIKAVAEKNLEAKESVIRGQLKIICYKPDGLRVVKEVLSEASKKYGIEVKYISAPKYMLKIKSDDAKAAEGKVKEAANFIIERIEKSDGEASFVVG